MVSVEIEPHMGIQAFINEACKAGFSHSPPANPIGTIVDDFPAIYYSTDLRIDI